MDIARQPTPANVADPARRLTLAITSVAAGWIHAVVVPEHLHGSTLFGTFFAVTAAFQVAWAALVLLRRDPLVVTLGAVANGALVVLWIVSRTVGLPIGPEPWMPEHIGSLDVTATVLELILVGVATLGTQPAKARRATV